MAYLHAFERMATMAGWPQYQWETILALYLTGPIQMDVDTLPLTEARDYERVKEMILSMLNISEDTYRTRMRVTRDDKEKGSWWLANLIRSNGMRWLKLQEQATEEVVELVWLEQFILVLPSAAQAWVMYHIPQTLEEAVRVMESYEAAERISTGGSAQRGEIWMGG